MINVYLKFPFRKTDSPYYKYLVEYPPKGVNYISEAKPGIIHNPFFFSALNRVKKCGRKFLEFLKYPNVVSIKKSNKFDLVHCAHCLLKNKDIPWVVDFEHYWTLAASSKIAYSFRGRKIIKKLLMSKNCKAILPWTNAAKNTLTGVIKEKEIEEKIHVVYPAIPPPRIKIKKPKGEINLLFVGRHFFGKGGHYFLEVVKRLKTKYDNINGLLISYTIPQNLIKKYSKYVEIKRYASEKELFGKIYPSSHIFLYPGFSDTFGFAFLEAMAYGLVIVTVDGFARNEIVQDLQNGFIVKKRPSHTKILEEPIVKDIYKKVEILIEKRNLLRKMSLKNMRVIKQGKFSLRERNKKLRTLFREFFYSF